MSNYGPNFEFRISPDSGERGGRYVNSGTVIPIGAPVKITGATDANGLLVIALATDAGDLSLPKPGLGGIAVYEYGPAASKGHDMPYTTYSDYMDVPAGAPLQVINGGQDGVKVVLRNTVARLFRNEHAYTGRKMVAGIAAGTVTVAVGDFLCPGVGDATSGYWKETSTPANAWLIVTSVDSTKGEVEARLNF